jgi:hypothetical protein
MTPTAERVRAEMRRFEEALPELLLEHRDRWVVFRDGALISVFDSEEEAYRDGLARFGRDGGHVVAKVAEQRTVPLTAAVVYQHRG